MAIFNSSIWNTSIFNTGDDGVVSPVVVVKTGTGGIDPEKRRKTLHLPVKPTGLLERPKAKDVRVQERLDESRDIQAEIAGRLAREFTEEREVLEHPRPIVEMSMQEVEAEIGILLRKKLRTEEEEVILLLLIAGASES